MQHSTTNRTEALVQIDLDDVRRNGSVRDAIVDRCPDEYGVASENHREEFIGQILNAEHPHSGASESRLIDPNDGTAAMGTEFYDDEGLWEGELVWTDYSVVEIEVPRLEDAVDYPQVAAEMAQSVFEDHGSVSDVDEWYNLVSWLKRVGEEFNRWGLEGINSA